MNSRVVRKSLLQLNATTTTSFTPSNRRIRHSSLKDVICVQCRFSTQKAYKGYVSSPPKADSEESTSDGSPPKPNHSRYKKIPVPRDVNTFNGSTKAKAVHQRIKDTDVEMTPFPKLQEKISAKTYEAITVKPFRHTQATPIQTAMIKLLPELAAPHSDDDTSRVDVLAMSPQGTGKSLAFLVPAIEARQKAITGHIAQELADSSLVTKKSLAEQAARVYTKTRVGTLILSTTREDATTTANEAILLSRNHSEMETRLFTGGMNKRIQIRDWIAGRRDVVVATPGRLRDLLAVEPAIREGFKHTQLLVIDQAHQLLEDGFRDDIDAIIEYLPKAPERQTFIFTERMNLAVRQMATRLLKPDHTFIDAGSEDKIRKFRETPQFHTILPSAAHQLPHLMKLIAHDQLSSSKASKVIIFVPTTRMAQLFSTFVRVLRTSCLPAGDQTNVYEYHSLLSRADRESTLESFKKDSGGSAVMVATDFTPGGISATRVIQLGIPSSDVQYGIRLRHAGIMHADGRNDLVLLPWEMGYLTWQLMDVPLEPLTVSELDEQVKCLSKELDERYLEENEKPKQKTPSAQTKPRWWTSPSLPKVERIETEINELLPRLDEESVRETFVSMLGYYIPKSGQIRTQRPVIVQGTKDWSVEVCGLPHPPYISDAFLIRLGITDGRTKRFGRPLTSYDRKKRRVSNSWESRGTSRGEEKPRVSWSPDAGNLALDRRDPQVLPEAYVTNLYGKPQTPPVAKDTEGTQLPRSQARHPSKESLLKQWGVNEPSNPPA